MFKNKKAAIEQLQSLIVPIIGIGIVLVVGFLIISEVQTQIKSTEGLADNCTATDTGLDSSHACNATREVQEALDDIPGWLPIIVITVIGVILLGLVSLFRRSG